MTRPGNRQRLDSLDALRAIACFFVICHHVIHEFASLSSTGSWLVTLSEHVDLGRVGVVAFFCISGFVIPSSFKGTGAAATSRFLINRFFRLYPAFWLSIGTGIICVWEFWGRDYGLGMILANLTMFPSAFQSELVMGHYWTLEVELVFYLICSAVCLFRIPSNLTISSLVFLGVYLFFEHNPLATFGQTLPHIPYNLCLIFAASCFRCYYDDLQRPLARFERYRSGLVVLLIAWLALRPGIQNLWLINASENPQAFRDAVSNLLGVAFFLTAIVFRSFGPLLPKLGRSTYSAYLFHAPVFLVMLKLWREYNLHPLPMEAYIAITTILTFLIAMISYRVIETPAISLGKRRS